MKALILSGGQGEGMQPLSSLVPKTMLYLHGKPILDHVIESLIDVGIKEFVIVVGHLSEEIVDYFSHSNLDIDIKLIQQGDRVGVEGAILAAEKLFTEDEAFFLAYGDILASQDYYKHIYNSWRETQRDGCLSVKLKGKTEDYGVAVIDSKGKIIQIKEKPPSTEVDLGNYVVAGDYILPNSFWTYLREEQDLEKTLNSMISNNIEFNAAIWKEKWVDLAIPWDLLDANELLFDGIDYARIHTSAEISSTAVIKGPVIIERDARIDENTVIKGPCYIGRNVYIGNNCLIRSNTMISHDCTIGFSCEIKNAVIQPESKIGRMSYIGDSVVGRMIRTGAQITTQNEIGFDEKGKRLTIEVRGNQYEKLGCVIGDKAFLGANTVTEPVSSVDASENIPPRSFIKGYSK